MPNGCGVVMWHSLLYPVDADVVGAIEGVVEQICAAFEGVAVVVEV